MLGGFLQATFGALLPLRCAGCDAPVHDGATLQLCEVCLGMVHLNDGLRCARCDQPGRAMCCEPRAFSAARAPYLYDGVMQDLVAASKFGKREDIAHALGEALAAQVQVPAAFANALVVPVPLGKRRRRTRGFNQSAVMARALGKAWRLELGFVLRRTRETAKQSDLPLAQRQQNVHGAFVAMRRVERPVVLVDDVITSGETAQAAAQALVLAGALAVFVVAAARTP